MELRELGGFSSVALTNWKREMSPAGFYCVQARMTVQSYRFAGEHDVVWFFRNEFTAFVQALRHFTSAHEGEARLEGMSPDMEAEAVVSIRRLDAAAHVVIEAQVAREHFFPRPRFHQQSLGGV